MNIALISPSSIRSGALLVEVVVGLALGVVFGVAIITMGIGTFDSIDQSRDQTIAVHYAMEGVEAMKTAHHWYLWCGRNGEWVFADWYRE
jgi:hypothetical protein